MKKHLLQLAYILASVALLSGSSACDKNGHINLLSVDQDKQLGAQTAHQIDSLKTQYPILDKASHPVAYAYLESMKNKILDSKDADGKSNFAYKDDFLWEMHIIDDSATLNAFCTPGGYIYVYSGIIKYLDTADYLAGVLGHEMGHADLRHTSRQITESQGYDLVLSVALGQGSAAQLGSIASQIIQLKYSRGYESEADAASVKYLSGGTGYACDGGKYFFTKLQRTAMGSSTPVFLSDHPSDESRIAHFASEASSRHCGGNFINESAGTTYAQFKADVLRH